MTTPRRLRPWEANTLACDICGDPAARWVSRGTERVESGFVVLSGDSTAAALVCEAHHEYELWRFHEEYGMASSEPVKDSWRSWWYGLPPRRRLRFWWNTR